MEQLKEMFPDMPDDALQVALHQGGNVDTAVEILLTAVMLEEEEDALFRNNQPDHVIQIPADGEVLDRPIGPEDAPNEQQRANQHNQPAANQQQQQNIPPPQENAPQANTPQPNQPQVDPPQVNPPPVNLPQNQPPQQANQQQTVPEERITEEVCVFKVHAVIPDVCSDHIKGLYHQFHILQGSNIVEFIVLTLLDSGGKYPRRQPEALKKRKRSLDQVINPYDPKNRVQAELPHDYYALSRKMLQQEFPHFPAINIDNVLKHSLYLATAYDLLFSIQENYVAGKAPPFPLLKKVRAVEQGKEREKISKTYHDLLAELEYAREKARGRKRDAQLTADAELAATLEIEEHEEVGMMMECQCCFGEYAFSKMTQCDEGHLFCMDCARRNAENEVGRGRYKLLCMAGCKSEFPRREVLRFLESKLLSALEKNEQQEVLRIADLENLTKCPFCDFAAICEPIELDKEFRCGNHECGVISCRHCQLVTHIPKSCEEVAKEIAKNDKLSVRHTVEEAMTEALIRQCKSCNNKFVKETGCNKMTCPTCRTIQCYVCGESIKGYDHFNDPNRGGSTTNKCPLFDNTEERHDKEIEQAAKQAMEKILADRPDISKEDLEIKMAENIKGKAKATPQPPAARAPPQPVRQPNPYNPLDIIPPVHGAPAGPVGPAGRFGMAVPAHGNMNFAPPPPGHPVNFYHQAYGQGGYPGQNPNPQLPFPVEPNGPHRVMPQLEQYRAELMRQGVYDDPYGHMRMLAFPMRAPYHPPPQPVPYFGFPNAPGGAPRPMQSPNQNRGGPFPNNPALGQYGPRNVPGNNPDGERARPRRVQPNPPVPNPVPANEAPRAPAAASGRAAEAPRRRI